MTFDLAQMIADREAGTPGEWFVVDTRHPWKLPAVDQRREMNGEHVERRIFTVDIHPQGKDHSPVVTGASGIGIHHFVNISAEDARRIARVPLFEAEIIRLTARVAELEGALSEFRSAAMWTKHAAEVLDGYEADYGEFLPLIYEIGRIPDSRKTASFRIYPNHIRGLADLLKPSAALSTHTEEPKT